MTRTRKILKNTVGGNLQSHAPTAAMVCSWREAADWKHRRHLPVVTVPQRCELFRRAPPTGIDSPAVGSKTASRPRRRSQGAVSPAEGSTSRREAPGSTVVHGQLFLAAAKAPISDKLGRPSLTPAAAGTCWSEGSNWTPVVAGTRWAAPVGSW